VLSIKQALFLNMIIFYAVLFQYFIRYAVITKYLVKLKTHILLKLSGIVDSLIVITRLISLEELINLNRSNKHQNNEKAKSNGILSHKIRRKISKDPIIDAENIDRAQNQIDKEANHSNLCLFEVSSLHCLNLENHKHKTMNDESKVKREEENIVSIVTIAEGLNKTNGTQPQENQIDVEKDLVALEPTLIKSIQVVGWQVNWGLLSVGNILDSVACVGIIGGIGSILNIGIGLLRVRALEIRIICLRLLNSVLRRVRFAIRVIVRVRRIH